MEKLMQRLGSFVTKHQEIILYVLVGGFNTVVGYGLYALCIFIGLHYAIATLIAQVLGVCINYITYGRLVFRSRPQAITFSKFILVYSVLYIVAVGIVALLQQFGLNAYFAGLISVLLMPIMSFLLNKFFVFAKKPKQEKS